MNPEEQERTQSMDAFQAVRDETLTCACSVPGEGLANIHETPPTVMESPGRYEEVCEFGRGGIGRVLLVHDRDLGRLIALKELLRPGMEGGGSSRGMSSAHLARFLREARITGQLEHPGIVPVYELARRPDGTFYYTMRFVPGRNLRQAIHDALCLEDRLMLLPHFHDLCQTIAYAHSRGVIHRDIKPSNVMIGEFGETIVIDWGLAKLTGVRQADDNEPDFSSDDGDSGLTMVGQVVGTPYYMPPEQAAGDPDSVTELSDVYALGAVLYEMLAGSPPYKDSSSAGEPVTARILLGGPSPLRALLPRVPPELEAICRKAMARGAGDRYHSARELADEIARYRAGAAVIAHEYTLREQMRRFVHRYRTPLAAACLAFMAIMCTGVYSYIRILSEKNIAISESERSKQSRIMADQMRAQSERDTYRMTIALADVRVRNGAPGGVPELLDTCPRSLRGWEWGHLKAQCTPPLASVQSHDASVKVMHLSASGETLYTSGDDGRLRVWSMPDLEPLGETSRPPIYPFAMDSSPRDGALICGVHDRLLRQSNPGEYPMEFDAIAMPDDIVSVICAPDGARLYAAEYFGPVYEIAMDTLTITDTFTDASGPFVVALGAEGKWLAYGDDTGRIFVRDLRSRTLLATLDAHEHKTFALAFNDDSTRLATSSYNHIRVYETAGWTTVTDVEPDFGAIPSLEYQGGDLLFPAGDGVFRMYQADKGQFISIAHNGAAIEASACVSDGSSVITGDRDGQVRLWSRSPVDNASIALQGGDKVTGSSAAFSEDGRYVATLTYEDSHLRVWTPADQRQLVDMEIPGAVFTVLSFLPGANNLLLAAGNESRTYAIGDTGAVLTNTDFWRAPLRFLKTAGDRVIAGFAGPGMELRERSTGRVIPLEGLVDGMEWTPDLSGDGGILAAASWQGPDVHVAVWDAKDGRLIETDGPYRECVNRIAFDPSGQYLALGRRDDRVAIWALNPLRQIRLLSGHHEQVLSLMFTPDGRRLLSGNLDKTLRVWDWEAGYELMRIENKRYGVVGVTMDPAGLTLAVTDAHAPIRLHKAVPWWDATSTSNWIHPAFRPRDRAPGTGSQ